MRFSENFFVEKPDCCKSLIQRPRCDLQPHCQLGQERFDFSLAGLVFGRLRLKLYCRSIQWLQIESVLRESELHLVLGDNHDREEKRAD